MEYKVVYANSIPELEKEVTALLNKGWTTVGGLAIGEPFGIDFLELELNHLTFGQAMLKE